MIVSNPLCLVRESPIHGKGVFAAETIPPGTVVVEYLGERIGREEAEQREAGQGPNGVTHIFAYDDHLFIDGAVGGNNSRYINHSCAANCAMRRENGRAFVYATRTIPAGEELSIDYAFNADDARVPCHCGAPDCRGFLNEIS